MYKCPSLHFVKKSVYVGFIFWMAARLVCGVSPALPNSEPAFSRDTDHEAPITQYAVNLFERQRVAGLKMQKLYRETEQIFVKVDMPGEIGQNPNFMQEARAILAHVKIERCDNQAFLWGNVSCNDDEQHPTLALNTSSKALSLNQYTFI